MLKYGINNMKLLFEGDTRFFKAVQRLKGENYESTFKLA